MRVIETSNPHLARKARLAQFRGVISGFRTEDGVVTGVVQSITENRLEQGVSWRITIRCKTERVAPELRRYNPRHRT